MISFLLYLMGYVVVGTIFAILGMRTGRLPYDEYNKDELWIPVLAWPLVVGGVIVAKFANVLLRLGNGKNTDV